MKQISNIHEYSEIHRIVREAQEALHGESQHGVHYSLAWILRGYGIVTTDREDVVRQGKKLLKNYEKEIK